MASVVHFSPAHAGSQLQTPVAATHTPLRLQLTLVLHLKGAGGGGGGGGCGWNPDFTDCTATTRNANAKMNDGRIFDGNGGGPTDIQRFR